MGTKNKTVSKGLWLEPYSIRVFRSGTYVNKDCVKVLLAQLTFEAGRVHPKLKSIASYLCPLERLPSFYLSGFLSGFKNRSAKQLRDSVSL